MAKDRLLELAKHLPGFDGQLLNQGTTCLTKRRERSDVIRCGKPSSPLAIGHEAERCLAQPRGVSACAFNPQAHLRRQSIAAGRFERARECGRAVQDGVCDRSRRGLGPCGQEFVFDEFPHFLRKPGDDGDDGGGVEELGGERTGAPIGWMRE